MEFQLALHKALDQFGFEIIGDIRLIGAIDDYHGFKEKPVLKHILRQLISSKYLEALLNSTGTKKKQVIRQIVNSFGFMPELLEEITIAYEAVTPTKQTNKKKSEHQAIPSSEPKKSPSRCQTSKFNFGYDEIGVYSEGLIVVRRGNKYGYIDARSNHLVIPCEYDLVYPFIDGRAIAKKNGKYGAISKDGSNIKPFIFSSYEEVLGIANRGTTSSPKTNTQHPFKLKPYTPSNSKSRFRSHPFGYDEIGAYSEGMIIVRKGNRYGFIDARNNEIVIPCRYDIVKPFFGGKAIVMQNGKYGIIDIKGRCILPFIYSYDEIKNWKTI